MAAEISEEPNPSHALENGPWITRSNSILYDLSYIWLYTVAYSGFQGGGANVCWPLVLTQRGQTKLSNFFYCVENVFWPKWGHGRFGREVPLVEYLHAKGLILWSTKSITWPWRYPLTLRLNLHSYDSSTRILTLSSPSLQSEASGACQLMAEL